MEPEGSLPCLQGPSTCPYPEPDQSSRTTPSYLSKIQLNINLHLRLGLRSGLLPSGFPTKILYTFSSLPFMLHALPRPSHESLLQRIQGHGHNKLF
jgi:hypothetical protein